MIETWSYTLISVIFVSLISLIGIFALMLKPETLNKIIIYLVSLSAGALFGGAFIHLLPDAFSKSPATFVSIAILSGIVLFFIVEKFIHWRHCHIETTKRHIHPVGYLNLLGDSIHNFIDGLVMAAAYVASIPIGIITTLAVILHEIPQEIGDFGVLVHAGFSKKKALLWNFISALTAIAGAIVGIIIGEHSQKITMFLVPLAAGGFIYIAGADLIPELHKDVCASPSFSRSFWQLLFFILGILLMFAMIFIE